MFKSKLLLLSKNTVPCRSAVVAQKVKWEGVVGLEIHAQVQSKSKLFSGAGTKFAEIVNDEVSLFDAAIPGTLPVLNRECIKRAVMTALALNCTVHETSWFDRKHYFYADLPAGYQITQQRAPFATSGYLEFISYTDFTSDAPCLRKSKIKQIQLEQDSGKSMHDESAHLSLIDLNRAGNPLMELVFEPDLQSGAEAACLVKELMLILQTLDTCSCRIEEGALRVDANISVRLKGSKELGVRTEVKNIAGVRNVFNAVNYEIERQVTFREEGREIVNETRTWDAALKKTFAMRDKEVEQDYRFMPEPNLPPLRLSLDDNDDNSSELINVPALKKNLPELPAAFRVKLLNQYQLPVQAALRLLVQPTLMNYFIDITGGNSNRNAVDVCHFLLYNVAAALNKAKLEPEECVADSKTLGEAYDLFRDQVINSVCSVRILDIIVQDDKESPREIVEKNQWYQISDKKIIEETCRLTIESDPDLVKEYCKSKKWKKEESFKKICLKAMEHTNGRANKPLLVEMMQNLLNNKK